MTTPRASEAGSREAIKRVIDERLTGVGSFGSLDRKDLLDAITAALRETIEVRRVQTKDGLILVVGPFDPHAPLPDEARLAAFGEHVSAALATTDTTVPGASPEGERLRDDDADALRSIAHEIDVVAGRHVTDPILVASLGVDARHLRRIAAALRVAPPSEPGPTRHADPKYVTFTERAAEMMLRRLEHGRAKFGVDWDEEPYPDEDNLERLRRAVDHLEAARRSTPDPEEWRKRAADVANQAFMFADPARLGEGQSRG